MDFDQRRKMALEVSLQEYNKLKKAHPSWIKSEIEIIILNLYEFLNKDLEKCDLPYKITELLKYTLKPVLLPEAKEQEIMQIKKGCLVVDWRKFHQWSSLDPVSVYRSHWAKIIYDIFYGDFTDSPG